MDTHAIRLLNMNGSLFLERVQNTMHHNIRSYRRGEWEFIVINYVIPVRYFYVKILLYDFLLVSILENAAVAKKKKKKSRLFGLTLSCTMKVIRLRVSCNLLSCCKLKMILNFNQLHMWKWGGVKGRGRTWKGIRRMQLLNDLKTEHIGSKMRKMETIVYHMAIWKNLVNLEKPIDIYNKRHK